MFFSVNVSNFTQNRCFFPIKAVLEDRGPAMLVIPKWGQKSTFGQKQGHFLYKKKLIWALFAKDISLLEAILG